VGLVSVRFRVGGLFLSPDPADFALLLDDDGLDFSDAVAHPLPGLYDTSVQSIEFEEVDLSQHRYFSLVVRPL
jgi:hypothetical protein